MKPKKHDNWYCKALLLVAFSCGYMPAGGIIDNGNKPENPAPQNGTLAKESRSETLLSGRYSAEIPGNLANKAVGDSNAQGVVSNDTFEGDGQFIQFKSVGSVCSSQFWLNDHQIRVYECNSTESHFVSLDGSIVSMSHNLDFITAKLVAASFQAK